MIETMHPLAVVDDIYDDEYDDMARHGSSTPGTTSSSCAGHSSSFATDRLNPTQVPSHHRQRPVQLVAWPTRAFTRPHGNIFIVVAVLLACCCSIVNAEPTPVLPDEITNPLPNAPAELHAQLDELAAAGTILFDQSPAPVNINNNWEFEIDSVIQEGLWRREEARDLAATFGSSSTATEVPASTASALSASTSSVSATSTVASSANSSAPASTAAAASSPLPSPFDSSLGANFTATSCPEFLTSFLNNDTFKSCLPISLLLESSISFFQVEKSVVRLTQTLDFSCAANVTFCTSLMSTLAANLTTTANCGADYAMGNPVVTMSYTGLITYKPLYQASCLKNPSSGSYCFADAVTNATSPEDSYVYYLALNGTLPGGSQPTCNPCLQNTMAVFSAAAANRSQPIANTYISAAQQINVNCGPNFVNATIPASISAAGRRTSTNPIASALVLAIFVMAWLL